MQPSENLLRLLRANVRTVVLTGAGISAESGVPTFRGGSNSLWDQFNPMELASVEGFLGNPKLVWEWYLWRRELIGKVQPNPGHRILVELERHLTEFTLITQNVDNLHQRAGSRNVVELHGNIHRNKCQRCGKAMTAATIDPSNLPRCHCGGSIRPDVVWFGELLPQLSLEAANSRAADAELFLSIGTSAEVFPAADLPIVAKRCGAYLVEINPDETRISAHADEVLRGPAGEVLPEIWRAANCVVEA